MVKIMIKFAAFDLDGTIGDTLSMSIEAFRRAAEPYLGYCLSYNEIAQTFGLNETGMMKRIVKDHWAEAMNDFDVLYMQMHKKCVKPYDGITDLLKYLRDNGVVLGLITGKGEKYCRITLGRFGLSEQFQEVLTGGETKNMKAESMSYLLDKYALSSNEFVYIGDTAGDVEESRKAGIICLSALWGDGEGKEAAARKNPEHLFYSVEDLKLYFADRI